VIVVLDEGPDLPFEIAGQIIVVEQDAVLHRLMLASCFVFVDDTVRHAHAAYSCFRAQVARSLITYDEPLSDSSLGRCTTMARSRPEAAKAWSSVAVKYFVSEASVYQLRA
jgi:hypothetical protein